MEHDACPVSSGLTALDHILAGGYAFNRSHLVEGKPGSGKTTLALQFLAAGRDLGDRCLYITLSESAAELRQVADSHGMVLDGIDLFELVPPELSLDPEQEQSVLYASDLELGETVRLVMAEVRRLSPTRIVFDSLSEIRLLAQGTLRYRRQVLALKHFFSQRKATVLFLDDLTDAADDLNLHSLAHGVVRLEQLAPAYGAERRRLRVYKMRARAFQGGYHDFVIRKGGVVIFPRLVAGHHEPVKGRDAAVRSGLAELDALTGGGLDRGTATLIQGPSGSGKSTLALQFLRPGLERGEKALFVSFDETLRNFVRRTDGMNFGISRHLAGGTLMFRQVDPAEMSPGELADMIRHMVEDGIRAVVIDSLSGYNHSMPDESYLLLQMHELLTYLNQQDVMTIIVLAQAGIIGAMRSPFDITYLADTVLLLRFFEAEGSIRRALSVVKKRTGGHELAIREMVIDTMGIQVGPSLNGFRGVLTGTPAPIGGDGFLSSRRPA